MNTLLSIFHLLLMLTHNRLLPDMGSVWKQASTENVIISPVVLKQIQTPSGKESFFQSEPVAEDNREPLVPAAHKQDLILLQPVKKNMLWPGRQSQSIKRYLVFCQLKIGG